MLKAVIEYGGNDKRTDGLFSVSAPRAMKKFFQGLKVSGHPSLPKLELGSFGFNILRLLMAFNIELLNESCTIVWHVTTVYWIVLSLLVYDFVDSTYCT